MATGGGMSPFTAARIFAGALAGLVLLRRLRQMVWKRRRREVESRKILIVGGGPVARSVARALRNDPLCRATVCGFVDNDLPLSPAVLGRIADLDWLARAEFIDEVILCLPGQPATLRQAAEVAFRNHLDIRAVPRSASGPVARFERRSHRRSPGRHLASRIFSERRVVSEAMAGCNWRGGRSSCSRVPSWRSWPCSSD